MHDHTHHDDQDENIVIEDINVDESQENESQLVEESDHTQEEQPACSFVSCSLVPQQHVKLKVSCVVLGYGGSYEKAESKDLGGKSESHEIDEA